MDRARQLQKFGRNCIQKIHNPQGRPKDQALFHGMILFFSSCHSCTLRPDTKMVRHFSAYVEIFSIELPPSIASQFKCRSGSTLDKTKDFRKAWESGILCSDRRKTWSSLRLVLARPKFTKNNPAREVQLVPHLPSYL